MGLQPSNPKYQEAETCQGMHWQQEQDLGVQRRKGKGVKTSTSLGGSKGVEGCQHQQHRAALASANSLGWSWHDCS